MVSIQGPVSYETNILSTSANGHSNRSLSHGYSRKRILSLSHPKESKHIWLTNFGPKLYWGNQDMMWPVSQETLHARPSARLVQLATAKKNFQAGTKGANRPLYSHSCGTGSQIWQVSHSAQQVEASDRIRRLARPKNPHEKYCENRYSTDFSCGRVSPIWTVSVHAQRSPDRPRTAQLAKPKLPHKNYVPNSEVETNIKREALYAMCSERVSELARPKTGDFGPFIDCRKPENSIWKVSNPARAATASPRMMELAKYKGLAEGYVSNRGVQWPISRSARRATTTPRTSELATPVIRASMDHVQFNPDAFRVSPQALKARCSSRVEDLARPLQR